MLSSRQGATLILCDYFTELSSKTTAIDAVVEKDLYKLLDEFRLIKHKFFLMCFSVLSGYLQALQTRLSLFPLKVALLEILLTGATPAEFAICHSTRLSASRALSWGLT